MILIDNVKVDFGLFPNGESNLNHNNIQFHNVSNITLKFEDDKDLFNLYILKKYIDEAIKDNRVILTILYMPYSRMDRKNDFYTFNLKYIAEMINDMNFFKVWIRDAHSDITPALINNCYEYSSIDVLFSKFREQIEGDSFTVMFPDAGAQKRYEKTIQGYNTVVGFKSRNFSNGNISSYSILGKVNRGEPVVIIDDLCSKGGTFIGAAKALKDAGAGDIYLIVGHCEENIFNGEIFKTDLIKKVYTTNSILPDEMLSNNRLYIYKLYTLRGKGLNE